MVGYYESWSARRPCNSFFPEQIPLGVYSIINFAFATIDPQTFEVLPDSSDDISMYSRVTALKKQDPSLRVFIAIGGWTFNDPGPTATTFSDIAGSETNQKAFFKSLIAFLNKYDFDGIDLDWEYPAADDRSGREEDYANFPSFIANLKNSLKQTSGRNGLSITLPASYWYLKHFDLVKLRKSVDFFNIMSYDLHGTWDKGNKWTGELLNPHTNITEIDLALDLLWRNDVDPSMVVMGLAFYARAYTLTDSSCTQPQCTFASGAKKGACSHESGILMNSEIDDIVDDKDLSPELWKDETVKVVHWDDQWLSYDDADTLKLKTDYARSLCLGGVMVWAISHDTKDAKYTKALAQVANRKITSLPSVEGPTYDVKVPHPQCKWTNCQDGCPSGWQLMKREDEHAHDGEWMFDGSGCDGVGIHALCCPSTETLPTCGWWTLPNRGGNCNPECPEGYKEVGSNSQYCDNSYQAACCSLKDSDNNYLRAMELYEGCEWAEAPLCDWGVCTFQGSAWPTELVDSYTGNGGAICNVRSYNPNDRTIDVQERKYCCDTATESRTWSNCEWVKTGLGSAGARCYPNCPSGKTRVALDTWGDDCRTSGARAYCCDADNYDVEQRYSDTIQQFRDAMDEWIKSPTCPRGSGAFSKRSLSTARSPDDISYLLHVRQDQTPIGGGSGSTDKVLTLLVAILAAMYQPLTDMITAERDAWDYGIKQKEQYDVLQSVPLQSFVTDETRYPPFQLEGPQETGERFLCQLDVTAALLARPSGRTILCDADMCTIDGLCFDDFDEDSPYSSSDRGLGVTARRGLEKRDDMGVEFDCIDAANPNGKKISWTKRPWISSGAWDSQNTIYDNGLTHIWEDHCSITRLRQSVLPDGELYASKNPPPILSISVIDCPAIMYELAVGI